MNAQYTMLQTATLAIADRLLRFHINILHRLVNIIPIVVKVVKHLCLLGKMLFNIACAVFKYFNPLPKVRNIQ